MKQQQAAATGSRLENIEAFKASNCLEAIATSIVSAVHHLRTEGVTSATIGDLHGTDRFEYPLLFSHLGRDAKPDEGTTDRGKVVEYADHLYSEAASLTMKLHESFPSIIPSSIYIRLQGHYSDVVADFSRADSTGFSSQDSARDLFAFLLEKLEEKDRLSLPRPSEPGAREDLQKEANLQIATLIGSITPDPEKTASNTAVFVEMSRSLYVDGVIGGEIKEEAPHLKQLYIAEAKIQFAKYGPDVTTSFETFVDSLANSEKSTSDRRELAMKFLTELCNAKVTEESSQTSQTSQAQADPLLVRQAAEFIVYDIVESRVGDMRGLKKYLPFNPTKGLSGLNLAVNTPNEILAASFLELLRDKSIVPAVKAEIKKIVSEDTDFKPGKQKDDIFFRYTELVDTLSVYANDTKNEFFKSVVKEAATNCVNQIREVNKENNIRQESNFSVFLSGIKPQLSDIVDCGVPALAGAVATTATMLNVDGLFGTAVGLTAALGLTRVFSKVCSRALDRSGFIKRYSTEESADYQEFESRQMSGVVEKAVSGITNVGALAIFYGSLSVKEYLFAILTPVVVDLAITGIRSWRENRAKDGHDD